MAGGRDKNKTLTEEAAVLAVSRQGHEFIQNRPKAQQLAYKLCATPEEFDLQKFNALRGVKGDPNPPQETTLADVASWLTPVAF